MTYQEYIEMACDMTKLMLWFVRHWLAGHPDETFVYVPRERCDIFRKTTLFKGWPVPEEDYAQPAWARVEDGLQRLLIDTAGEADSARFEEEGLELLRPLLEEGARAIEPYGYVLERHKLVQCGSLRYDPPNEANPRQVFFHIANALSPRSIFDDPAHLPACLRCVMDRSQAEYGTDLITTTSWLNSYPAWLRLFPPEWQRNLGPPLKGPYTGLGYWGQMINARGTFNHKHAAIFRRTGSMPFPPRKAWCSFAALREHLKRIDAG